MRRLNILLIVLFVQFSAYAVEYITYQDNQRYVTYNQNRIENLAKPFTDNIARKLTDHTSIDYSRTATEAQREKIYKAIFGTVFVHQNRFESLYQQTTYTDRQYQNHFNALWVVDQSARVLWESVKRGSYIHSLEQANNDFYHLSNSKGFRYQKLLTTNFIKWFYEALESYCHELNFFGGTATLEWFQQIAPCYQKGASIPGENLKILLTDDYKQTGIYKSLRNTSTKKTGRDRQVKAEYTSWLLAKAAGLTRVVNPVIPVRIQGNSLVIDPENYQGTLEPFAGLPIYDYASHSPTIMSNYPSQLKALFSRALNHSNALIVKMTRISSIDRHLHSLLMSSFGSSFSGLSSTYSEKLVDVHFPTVTLSSFASYFSAHQSSFLTPPVYVQPLTSRSESIRYADLETFNRCVSQDDLLSLIAFWHITQQDDMNPFNIIFRPTVDGQIIPTVIDYDISLGSNDGILKRVPMVYPLKQTSETFGSSLVQRIKDISTAKLLQVLGTYELRRKPTLDKTKDFSSSDSQALSQRLENLRKATNPNSNLRKLIHDLILYHFEKVKFQKEANLLTLKQDFEKKLQCTIVDPILQISNSVLDDDEDEYLGCYALPESGSLYHTSIVFRLYRLEWVFAADRRTFGEGENDGTNLKGYLSFRNQNLLCGLGI